MKRPAATPYLAAITCFLVLTFITACSEPTPANTSTEPISSPSAAPFSYEDDAWQRVSIRFPSAVRPEVDLLRFVTPGEMAEVQAQCLRGEGFPDVAVTPDGALSISGIPAEQEEALAVTRYVCEIRYQMEQDYTGALEMEELTELYTYYTQELVPCLQEKGYTPDDAPSVTTFADTYGSPSTWSPYSSVQVSSNEAWYEINEACPQWPRGFWG